MTLDELNGGGAAEAAAALRGVFENAPWVAQRAVARRPFATVGALHDAMLAELHAAPPATVLAFLRGHPELAGDAATRGAIGPESKAEQAGAGLDRPMAEAAEIAGLNAAYAGRFGFPFILCVRRHTRASLLAEFRRRSGGEREAEWAAALREVGFITRLRLADLVSGPGMPAVHGRLSTHVLDTVRGRPAAGVPVTLHEVGGWDAVLLAQAVTNGDGRTDAPLLAGAPLRIGAYELRFTVGGYFGEADGFLDVIPVRFRISEPESHYHVPLLVSPGAYSTYRGS